MWPIYILSVDCMINWRVVTSIMGLIEGFRGLCLMIALLYNLILGLLKAEVSTPYEDRIALTADRWFKRPE